MGSHATSALPHISYTGVWYLHVTLADHEKDILDLEVQCFAYHSGTGTGLVIMDKLRSS